MVAGAEQPGSAHGGPVSALLDRERGACECALRGARVCEARARSAVDTRLDDRELRRSLNKDELSARPASADLHQTVADRKTTVIWFSRAAVVIMYRRAHERRQPAPLLFRC
jgi:hypothetical protein